ncbi:MAG: hypothetical protein ACI89X_000114 [Planctomycetota bacterium]|jgi:hypothetical protein
MLIRLSLLLLTLLAPLAAQSKDKVIFERHVFPILKRNCIECHRAEYLDNNGRKKRPKGKVMFDTLANIKKSKRGRLFVANDTDASLILDSITLPADDEDRMPPAKAGPPLSKRDVDLITKWIDQGADFGTWTGEAKKSGRKPKPPKPTKSTSKKPNKRSGPSPVVTLSKGLQPISAAVLKSFAGSEFQVKSVGDGNPLLSVTCCGKTENVTDATLAKLAPIAANIFELDLARSEVGDAGCRQLAKMPRLVKLSLRQTQVGNSGVKELAACQELRSLNLFGTATGDYALTALASLKHLRSLYLYETETTANAVVRLRKAIPGLRVVSALDLPEPMAEEEKPKRRRR